jgi:riboflavin synthase
MFTGIVEEAGTVVTLQRGAASARITVQAPLVSQNTKLGDSIAINGVCLTVVEAASRRLSFEAVPETMRLTSLGRLKPGDRVNLERALAVGQRLGGHFVQGHVDGTGTLAAVTESDNARILRIEAPPDLMRYLAAKGSIALDGISLTVVDVLPASFTVWIIPHTFANTTLGDRRVGDALNIEVDMLAKYIERLLEARIPASGVTLEKLTAAGYVNE